MTDGPRILFDRGTGRPILMSPLRLARPRHTGPDRDGAADCPFCSGNENETPPEVDAVRAAGSAADAPGWIARAFPNRYPAAIHHEVIAEGERHTIHPAHLTDAELRAALDLYARRIGALESHDDVRCAFLFKNVGPSAGASIAHNHSQLLGLPMLPPRLEAESAANHGGCIHCAEIESAGAEDRVVTRTDHHVLLTPSTPKLPFECWLLPTDHDDDFLAPGDATDLQDTLRDTFARADRAFRGGAFNLYLHRIPTVPDRPRFHWHFELQPRVGSVAALEIGGDMYINAVTPQASARRWRTPEP